MRRYSGAQRITKIIQLSNNYQRHRDSLSQTKSMVDSWNYKRNKESQAYLIGRAKNIRAVNELQKDQLQKKNDQFVKRICQIAARPTSKISIKPKKSEKNISVEKHQSRASSVNSSRTSSQQSLRRLKNKQLQRQNKKIAQRIQNAKRKHSLGPEQMRKSYQKDRNYARLRSRFSDYNKKLLESMVTKDMNIKRKNAQFLPQIFRSDKEKIPTKLDSFSFK